MLKGINEKGEMKNVKVSNDGEVLVKMNNEGSTEEKTTQAEIVNTSENAIPVSVQKETETTLNASVQTVGTTATTIAINKKVTKIDIANYSESANVTLVAGSLTATIGANLATTIAINKQVDNISLTASEADTKVQIVVSGVE